MRFNGRDVPINQWQGEYLGAILATDTETDIRPFHDIAELQTMQVYNGKAVYYVLERDVVNFEIVHESSIQIMHNAPFDLDVIGKVLGGRERTYYKVDNRRIYDTLILYKLWHLAHIGFTPRQSSLKHCCSTLLGVELDKNVDVRCTFDQYKNVDIKDIPIEHLEYGAADAVATWDLYFVLMSRIKQYDKMTTLLSYDIQLKGAIALDQIYKNGIGFDLQQRDEWLKGMNSKLETEANVLATWGWVRGKKGIKDVYENIINIIGLSNLLPRTEDGSISSKSEDLEKYSYHPFIDSYLKFQSLEKATTFVRDICTERVHPRYNLLVNTGRTSCSKPNFQQLPRMGGVREMFIAKKDHTFTITDYSAVELATLSQVTKKLFGYSVMGDLINQGKDLHYETASECLKKPIASITRDERQKAKAINFGKPGGLGVTTLINIALVTYGVTITEEEAQEWLSTWMKKYPEMSEYLKGEQGYVYTTTGRRRANTTFCAEKNTPFQGLAADGAKLAMYNLCKANFKIVGFVHDEVICEVHKDVVESTLIEQEKIMIEGMKQVVPDFKIGVESMISPFYTK